MYLTTLADVARRTGRKVVEIDGWQGRGHGQMSGVKTIAMHHTAGALGSDFPSRMTLIRGRPDLTGPLSHFGISRDGTIYVVAAGLCYHAGAVLDDTYTNAWAIGIECENNGIGEAWGSGLLTSMRLLCLELSKEFHVGLDRVLGHKEICKPPGRKTDPDFDMDAFRVSLGYKGAEKLSGGRATLALKAGTSVAFLAAALGVSIATLHDSNPAIPDAPAAPVKAGTNVIVPPSVTPPEVNGPASPTTTTSTPAPVPVPASAPVRAPSAPVSAVRVLRYGSTGHDVRTLQGRVGTRVDGVFGRQTLLAVERAQRIHHIKVDGIVGPQTRKALGI